ncbi:hypothetical protein RhiirC2_822214 [Rhizophagus irregularis]|uniref:CCHC-type domain-containing protein n=1 Tax=Rhizophagus irregularis TaxID=588596 RepID=A0A2N1MAZ5_9GLOM|nr:hypothetical protein RhiirC2_822214 [Rhizophagus irregularis]
MAGMTLNSATINAINFAVKNAVKKKYAKCSRFGHTSRKCPRKKKKKSKKSKKDSGLITSKQIVAEKIVSQNDVSSSSKDSDESSLEEEFLDDPIEIYFVQKKEPKTSVATVKCKIKRLKIPAMTRTEPPIIMKNIVDRIKEKIDKSEKHDLSGVATVLIEFIGIVRKLPITLAPGCTIHEDFLVVDYHKLTLIFSNQLLKKYGCILDWNTNELKVSLNEKNYIIPVTMHKIKNKLKVNCVTTTPECDKSLTPDCVLQDLSEDNDVLKKKEHWLGSAYEQELEKKIRSVTEFNSEINDLSEKLVDKYNEREKEFENKASQLNASTTKVRS